MTEANDKLPLPSVLSTWLLIPSDFGNLNPPIVAESAVSSPVTVTPESVVSNFLVLSAKVLNIF